MSTDTLTLYPDAVESLHHAMPVLASMKPMFNSRGFVAVEVAWTGMLSGTPVPPAAAMDADLLIVPLILGYLELRKANISGRNLVYTGRPVRAADQYRGAVQAVGEFAQLLGLPVVIVAGRDPRI